MTPSTCLHCGQPVPCQCGPNPVVTGTGSAPDDVAAAVGDPVDFDPPYHGPIHDWMRPLIALGLHPETARILGREGINDEVLAALNPKPAGVKPLGPVVVEDGGRPTIRFTDGNDEQASVYLTGEPMNLFAICPDDEFNGGVYLTTDQALSLAAILTAWAATGKLDLPENPS